MFAHAVIGSLSMKLITKYQLTNTIATEEKLVKPTKFKFVS